MTSPSRLRSLAFVAAFVAAALLGACGTAKVEVTGKAKTLASDAASAALDTDVTIVDGTTQDTSGDTAPSTTRTVPAPTTASAPTTAPAPAERSDEAFCKAAGKVLDTGLQSMPDLDLADPDLDAAKHQLIESMHSIEQIVTAMDRAAPPAIATDMHTVAAATTAAVASIDDAKSGEDLFNSMSDLTTSEVASATERVTRYTVEHCGFSLEGTTR